MTRNPCDTNLKQVESLILLFFSGAMCKLPVLTSIILFVVKAASSSQPPFAARVDKSVDSTRTDDFFKLTHLLVLYNIPQCLRILMIGEKMKISPLSLDIGFSQQKTDVLMENPLKSSPQTFELSSRIILQAHLVNQTHRVLSYINKNTGRVTSFSCVAYILTRPLDYRLLPVLTDPSSSKQLTRYFLIQALNSAEVNKILLDQRLGEEMNVAAVSQWESKDAKDENSGLWYVYNRQLMHHSGSPQIFCVNTWSKMKGFGSAKVELFPEQMGNFYGKKLKGSSLDFKPFINYNTVEGSRVVRPRPALDIKTLNVIADTLNFTYDLVMPEDGHWGYLGEDVSSSRPFCTQPKIMHGFIHPSLSSPFSAMVIANVNMSY